MNSHRFQFMLATALACCGVNAAQAQDFVILNPGGFTFTTLDLHVTPMTIEVRAMDRIRVPESDDTLAFSSIQDDFGGALDARAAAFQSLSGINATFVEAKSFVPEFRDGYTLSASTLYSTNIGSNMDLAGQMIPFKFVIDGGQLRIDDIEDFEPLDSSGGAFAGADIRINADRWRFTARLTKDTSGDMVVVPDEDGNMDSFFNFARHPSLTVQIVDADDDGEVDDAIVDIPQITGEIFINGEEFNAVLPGGALSGSIFQYEMLSKLKMVQSGFGPGNTKGLAGITDPFALGTPDDPSDDLGGPFSTAGVQFFLADQALSSYGVTFVPEPSTALLAGVGVILLAVRRRASR